MSSSATPRGAFGLALVALLALDACAKTGAPPVPPPPAATCTATAPCALAPGAAMTGKIDAVGRIDHYTVEVPAALAGQRVLVALTLANAAPVSPVRLVFLLEAPGEASVLGGRGPVKGSGPQSLAATFLLPGPGVYPLLVRDATNQNADPNNAYTLATDVFTDPDTGEPDDAPALARTLQPAAESAGSPAQKGGLIASAGDRDLLAFELARDGLVRWTVQEGAAAGPLQLRARILARSASAPDDLGQATLKAEVLAAGPGKGVSSDVVRFLEAGRYLISLEDKAGSESDARPLAAWTTGLQLRTDPDPNEQLGRNDTAQTATQLEPNQSKEGAIGSQGDADWYQVDLPAADRPMLVELSLAPGLAGQDLELDWAVGDVLAAPSGPCDTSCGPFAFCSSAGQCLYALRGLHHFAKGDSTAQSVRLRHQGAARTLRVLVSDQGGDERSDQRYTVSSSLVEDPDPQEPNDALDAGTPLAPLLGAGGRASYSGSGRITWWEFIDGRTTARLAADVDSYTLALPPREQAPACPEPGDGGIDPGADAGPCTPPGGPAVELPRPAYGLVARWRGPSDDVYRLGFQGNTGVDGGVACVFSFDERFAHAGADGGWALGDLPTDPCFCLGAANAQNDALWVRVEAAHRPAPPEANKKSDQPFSFTLELSPADAGLQPACAGACASQTRPSLCPGN